MFLADVKRAFSLKNVEEICLIFKKVNRAAAR